MNVSTRPAPLPALATPVPRRSARRERGFGTGYGRSSGYADDVRRYAGQDAEDRRFRVH